MKTILAALALALAAGTAQAATVANGSFEDPGTFLGQYQTINTGGTIGAWTVDQGSVDLIRTYWQAGAGSYSLDMAGNGPAVISQTLSGLTAGGLYSLSFLFSGNPDVGGGARKMDALIDGLTVGSVVFDTNAVGNTLSAMGWVQATFTFVAPGASVVLGFSSLNNGTGPWGPALDAVSVAAVPVPAAAPLLLLALGGLGMMARKRRRAS